MRQSSLSTLFLCSVLSLSQLTACQPPNTTQEQTQNGTLKFSVQWPTLKSFKTQAIPDNTTQIEVHISGDNLNPSIVETLSRSNGNTSKVYALPEGRKVVRVTAKDSSGKDLAITTQTVTIVGGKSHRLEMDLEPLDQPTPEPSITPEASPENPVLNPGSGSGTPSALQPLPPNTSTPNPAPAPNPNTPTDTGTNPTAPTNTTNPVINIPTNNTTTTTGGTSGSSSSSSGSSGSSGSVSSGNTKTPVISSVSPSNAAPGSTVVLTGTDLDGVTSVIFHNGVAASTFTVDSSTQITATVPAAAHTGPISVSNGTNSTAFTGFSIQYDLSGLQIQEVFAHNDTATQRQYIKLKNYGGSTINAGNLYLHYTQVGGTLANYQIPTNSPNIPPNGELIITVNKDPFAGGANEIYTGDAGFEDIQANTTSTTEVFFCRDAAVPCADMVRYMAFGNNSTGSNTASAVAVGLWTGNSKDANTAMTAIQAATNSTTNYQVGDGLIFGAGETVVVQTSSGERRQRNLTAANSTDVTVNTSLNETIQGSNASDGNSGSGLLMNQNGIFSTSDVAQVRDNLVLRAIAAVPNGHVQLTAPISTDADSSNTGSGSATGGAILTDYNSAGSPPPIKTGDDIKLVTNPANGLGHGTVRQVTGVAFNGGASRHEFNINTFFAKLDFQNNQMGTGSAVPLEMVSIPAALQTGQKFGGRDKKAFSVTGFGTPNSTSLTLDRDLSQCTVIGSGNGDPGIPSPIQVSGCDTQGVMLMDGDRIVTDAGVVSGEAVHIGSPGGITGPWPTGPINITLQGPFFTANVPVTSIIYASPSGGAFELVPDGTTTDNFFTIPKSGLLHLVPKGGFVKKRQSLVYQGGPTDTLLDSTKFSYSNPTL